MQTNESHLLEVSSNRAGSYSQLYASEQILFLIVIAIHHYYITFVNSIYFIVRRI